MKVIPMLFQTELVRALLEGRKTVTRRPLTIEAGWELKDRKLTKITSSHPKKGKWGALIRKETFDDKYQHDIVTAPCFVGDLIYVRETFMPDPDADHDSWDEHELSYFEWAGCDSSPQFLPDALKTPEHCIYKANGPVDGKWTPSIHMPRWASRLTLKVIDVRIEQVQDITEQQAQNEGFRFHSLYNEWGGLEVHPDSRSHAPQWRWYEKASHAFKYLWNNIYNNWDQNPYVWVIEFEVIHKNVDQVISEMEAANESK